VQAAAARRNAPYHCFHERPKRAGMRSALLTQHVKPRPGVGWHYHGHCVVEFKPGVDGAAACAKLEGRWWRATTAVEGLEKPLFRRMVCGPGEALTSGAIGGQGEFWAEPQGAVERCLQYTVRDVVQGCEGWVEHLRSVEEIEGFVQVISGAKLHRLYGAWRKKAASEVEAEGSVSGESTGVAPLPGAAGSDKVWHEYGNVSRVWESARSGDTVAQGLLERLSSRYCNRGKLCRRLGIALHCCSGVRRAG
jgi:hypothetical protein